jgi:tRNA threonylcarbamoyladenosine biosynthesis protein TsaE
LSDWRLLSHSPEMTRQLGELLGSLAQPGTVLALAGDLGSGKTCLTRGFARGVGVSETEPVTSPTYTLMNHYRGRLDLYHFDFYRLSTPDELVDLGFNEYLCGAGVVVYEWSQRFEPLELDAVQVSLIWVADDLRDLTLSASGPLSEQILEAARRQWRVREAS